MNTLGDLLLGPLNECRLAGATATTASGGKTATPRSATGETATSPATTAETATVAVINRALAESVDVLVALVAAHRASIDHLALLYLAVLEIAADVVEEGGLLVVSLFCAGLCRDYNIFDLSVTVGGRLGDSAVLLAGHGLAASDLFLDKILLVELRVGTLKVVVLGRNLHRLVCALAPHAGRATAATSASAATGRSILYSHLVHFLGEVVHASSSLLDLWLLATRRKFRHSGSNSGSSGVRGIGVGGRLGDSSRSDLASGRCLFRGSWL